MYFISYVLQTGWDTVYHHHTVEKEHPLIWISNKSANFHLLSWQKLSEEDIEAFEKSKSKT
jgi:hypothetical protein